eukprot:5538942-Alexandrium_andersonii.AAC.1
MLSRLARASYLVLGAAPLLRVVPSRGKSSRWRGGTPCVAWAFASSRACGLGRLSTSLTYYDLLRRTKTYNH